MRHIFYAEGYSEENFLESFLLSNNFEYTKDLGEFRSHSTTIYLKNCKSDSAIKPSLIEDKWWIQEISTMTASLWVACDLNDSMCYRELATEYRNFLTEQEIHQNLILINSRPNLENIYFENREHILNTVLALHNTTFPQNTFFSVEQLSNIDLIRQPSSSKIDSLKRFCRINLGGRFNKNEFSKKFFSSLFSASTTNNISICNRLEHYLSTL